MKRLVPLVVLLLVGCSNSPNIKAKGRVLKGGQPFTTQPGEGLRIILAPMAAPATGQYDSFAAEFDPSNGSFRVRGKDGTGLPPGKYRVSLQLMKNKEDQFRGRYVGLKSPFVVEVGQGGGDLVIDLDQKS
jgi:hypothetical protein